jgi:putative transposase
MRLHNGEKWPGWQAAKKTLQASKEYDPALCGVYGKLLHEVYFRLDAAMKAFFRRVKNGEKPGFPRVRPRHCFFTLCYPAMYLKIEGKHIILPTGGRGKNKSYPDIIAKLTEEAPTGYKEVAISRDGQGHYYASFVSEQQEETREHNNGVLAIDLGIKTLATGVNEQGRFYHIGGFKGGRWYTKQLDRLRSKRDRCKKGSRRYRHLSQVYQRVSQKKRNKQQDCLHKASHLIAHKTVERTIVIGDLSQRQMVMKKHAERNKYLNRAVFNEWGLYTFVQMLTYSAIRSLQTVVIRGTSGKENFDNYLSDVG